VWVPASVRPAAWWPFVAAMIPAAGIPQLFRPNVRESRRRHRSLPLASGATAIVGITLVAWLTTTSRAAAPAPATVFLVPGPDGETSTVLLPPELAEQPREPERNG